MGWKFNPFTGSLDQTGSSGPSVFEGEVATFADLPQTVDAPPVGSAYLVRESTGVWLVNRRQAGVYIRSNNTGVRADDWTYGGDYPVTSVNGLVGSVSLAASDVGAPPTTRTISAGTGLTGGGDLSANRTLSVSFGSSAGTACEGNDARLSDARTPTAHAASHAAGTKASYTGIGINESLATYVTIRANTAGTEGNSIALAFDGVDDIDTVLAAWNSDNPSNQATLISGDGSQVPENGEEITLSGGTAVGSDPITDPTFNSIGIGAAAPSSKGQVLVIRTEESSQDSLLKAISTQNTEDGDGNWRGRIMAGAENKTFLIGCAAGEAGLGAHNWASAKNEIGAAWSDFLLNPDGNADVFIGCASWDKNTAILKVGNSDGKVTIADQSDPTKKVDFDVSGVTTETTRTLEIPDASGVIALVGDTPAAHTHGNITNEGLVGTISGLPLKTGTGGIVEAGAFGTSAGTFAEGNDSRLSDSREWSADTISQAEAETGTSTTRRAFTALRVFQAIAAWWNGSAAKTKLDGIASGATANSSDATLLARANHTGTQNVSTLTAGNWKLFYSNGSGAVTELALGSTAGHVLQTNGASSAPSFAAVSAGATNLWITGSAFIPRTTNGCGVDSREQSTNKINTDELLFDAAAIEYAQAAVVMPSNWNAGTVTAKFYWTASSGSGDVVWQIAGRALANDDALDQAMGTAQTATDTLTAANDMDISPATSAVTLAGSPAAGQLVIYEISRKATDAADTLAVDARLLGVELSFN